VGPYTSLGQNVRVISSEVEYSILIDGASLGHLSQRVDSSILGQKAQVVGETGTRNTAQFFLGDGSSIAL
jgi:glucose-1-phosphate thymidylyltransferase